MSPKMKTKRDLNDSWSVMLSGRCSGRSGLSSFPSSYMDMGLILAPNRIMRADSLKQREDVAYGDRHEHQRRGREHHEAHRDEVRGALDQGMDNAQADITPGQADVQRVRDPGQVRVHRQCV